MPALLNDSRAFVFDAEHSGDLIVDVVDFRTDDSGSIFATAILECGDTSDINALDIAVYSQARTLARVNSYIDTKAAQRNAASPE